MTLEASSLATSRLSQSVTFCRLAFRLVDVLNSQSSISDVFTRWLNMFSDETVH